MVLSTLLNSFLSISRLSPSIGQYSSKGRAFGVESDPFLHGYWGENCFHTISHQSVQLGIPAIQLEIPRTMRRELFKVYPLFDEPNTHQLNQV
jgi:hypothetical protein